MSHLPWYRVYPSNRSHAANDIELLQTDVMRFMAILGLSLMAIFALVQGLAPQSRTMPRSPPTQSPSLLAESSQRSAEHNEMHLRALQGALDEARQERHAALATATRAEQAALAAKEEAAAAARRRAELLAALAKSENAIRHQQLREARLRRTLRESERSVAGLRRELESERQENKIAAATPVTALSEPSAPQRPASLPRTEGFSLRFASDTALRSLVMTGAVAFYGVGDQVAWRLTAGGGGLRYRSAPLPRTYHEMQALTVPRGFVEALENSAARDAPATVIWGVTLSAKITHSIHRLMQRHSGGSLVIDGNGHVRREGANA